jgi:hypothetical protein
MAFALAGLLALPSWGCDVPVFRYALEKWEPDVFHIAVLHRAPLSEEEAGVLSQLKEAVLTGETFLNLGYIDRNLEEDPWPEVEEQLAPDRDASKPRVALLNPVDPHRPTVSWEGPLSRETIGTIIDSPLRREITDHLLKGAAAVWVLLEGGDTLKDASARATLEAHLAGMETSYQMPTETGAALIEQTGLKLPLIVLSRDNPKERVLIDILLHVEPDLLDEEFAGEPMAFPIYGRGRVLYSLVGGGITPDLIEEAMHFLLGACSCEVKDLNPGVDLLLSADWKNYSGDPMVDTALLAAYAETGLEPPESAQAGLALPRSGTWGMMVALAGLTLIVAMVSWSLLRGSSDSRV